MGVVTHYHALSMKVSNLLRRCLPWAHLPLGLLVALLQRTPAVRVIAGASDYVMASRAGELLRAAFAAAGLGAVHSLAGATTYVQSPVNPVRGEVGQRLSVAFTFTGAPSEPQHWIVLSGQLPPGMAFVPVPLNGVIRTGAPAITGTPTQAGIFSVRVRAIGLAGESEPIEIRFEITGSVAATPPTITAQPQSQSVPPGANVTFSVQATGSPSPAYQWTKNGANILGATAGTLVLPSVQAADAGSYAVVVANTAGAITSDPAVLSVNPPSTGGEVTARLSNLSVRAAMTAGQTLIVGFAVSGGNRPVLVRGAGPTLAGFGLSGAMTDPRLQLFADGTLVAQNDNWGNSATLSAAFASVGGFPFLANSADAAFLQTVEGTRSVHLTGTGAGVALVELYDTGTGNSPRLVNVSTRNEVGVGDNILIFGFFIDGTGSKNVLIRAVGPTLGTLGVNGVLLDPRFEVLRTGSATVEASNDNWSAALAPTFSAVGAFPLGANSRDAALVTSLAAGNSYTVQVSGVNNTTGEALVEIYEVP